MHKIINFLAGLFLLIANCIQALQSILLLNVISTLLVISDDFIFQKKFTGYSFLKKEGREILLKMEKDNNKSISLLKNHLMRNTAWLFCNMFTYLSIIFIVYALKIISK